MEPVGRCATQVSPGHRALSPPVPGPCPLLPPGCSAVLPKMRRRAGKRLPCPQDSPPGSIPKHPPWATPVLAGSEALGTNQTETHRLHSPSLLPAGLWSVKSSRRQLSTSSGSPPNQSPSAHPWAGSSPCTLSVRSRAPLSTTAQHSKPPALLVLGLGGPQGHSPRQQPRWRARRTPRCSSSPALRVGTSRRPSRCKREAGGHGASRARPGCGARPFPPHRGPYEYVLMLRPDLYTAKHTQWFYFRVQNTRQEPLYRFTIANMAKPKSLYGQGLQPLLYSQQDAQSRGIGWRRVGTDICYCRGSAGELPLFRLSWTVRFPHDGDTCFFASCYPYTYSDLQRYLRALAADPARSRYCTVQVLCRSLAGNSVYLLTITGPGGTAGKQVVVASARVHPGESGGSWAMRGFLDFLLSAHADAQLLRRLFVFKVVPMLNPDGVVVGNSRCSLAGRDPNRAYGMALPGSFPGVWHLRAMVQRMLAEQEVVLYCDFHGHSRKNNVFMYGCDASRDDTGTRLRQRVFPLMLSKNAPDKVGQGCLRATCCGDSGNAATVLLPQLSLWGWDPSDPGTPQFSFSSCKFQVQKSKERTGRVCMWRLGVSHSYTLEVAFSGSTLGGRKSHFSMEDLESLGRLLCDTLLEFCDPATAKLQQCLVEADALLQRRMGGEPGSGGSWSNVSPSELESSTSGSDSSVSDGIPDDFHIPDQPMEPRRRKRLQKRRARNGLHQTNRNRTGIPAGTRRHPVLPGVQNGSGRAGEKPRGSSNITIPRAAGAGNGPHAITGEMLGAHSGVALPRAPEGGSSHGATMGKHQLDTGTSAVTHHKPPLSPHHCGASSYSRDPAVGAILGPSWQRGGRRPRDRTRPLTVPAVASRCYACARQ
ncbi:cytosolic carboxypeptidase 2 isoform X2 [Catharus ustulatus]|uniref:cytosolic carboxypeptidase 2 isoform X2 n=1 Tax=Catharus ustulatus TaxID=91951 RepID=UPI001408D537|nr:cytosolic carboxypeptidase 2 isoform X2 [Catharus ustulatus]